MDTASFAFEQALLASDRVAASAALGTAGNPESALRAIDGIVMPALDRIGQAWEAGRVALAQVYMAGRICEDLIAAVLPSSAGARRSGPVLAVATLQDHHLLGKRLVLSVLRSAGHTPLDYGSIPVDELVSRVLADRVEILLLSVLMLPSALLVRDVREGLKRADVPVRIVVGGAPFRLDPELWREVGADAMGALASDSAAIVEAMTGGAR